MKATDVCRLSEDLATMRQAAQVELPFGRMDAWGAFGVGVWGVVLAIWMTLAPQAHPRLAFYLLGILAVPVLWSRHVRRSTMSPSRRRTVTP